MEKHLDRKYIIASFVKQCLGLIIFFIFISIFIVSAMAGSSNTPLEVGAVVGTFAIIGVVGVIILGLTILNSYLFYKTFTYQLGPDAFVKKYGVLTRRSMVIPYNRVQNVDIIEPLTFRIFGLAQLNIQTAAEGSVSVAGAASLPGVSKQDADMIRDEILRLALVTHKQPQTAVPHDTGL